MDFITRDTGQTITFTEGQRCEIEKAKYVVLKVKGQAPGERIEVLIEVKKLDGDTYQGKIHSFQAELGKPPIPAGKYGTYKQHDLVDFEEKKVFRIMCP